MSYEVALKMLSYREEAVGKILNISKRKYVWTFQFDEEEHVLEFTLSVLSQKYSVTIDGYEKDSGHRSIVKNFECLVRAFGRHFTIVQRFMNFDLYIDGIVFKPNTTAGLSIVTIGPIDNEGRDKSTERRLKAQTETGGDSSKRKVSIMDNFRNTIVGAASDISSSLKEGTMKLFRKGKETDSGFNDKSKSPWKREAQKDVEKSDKVSEIAEEEGNVDSARTSVNEKPNPFIDDIEKWKEDAFTQSVVQKMNEIEKLDMPLAIVYEQDIEDYLKVDFDARTEQVEKMILNCY